MTDGEAHGKMKTVFCKVGLWYNLFFLFDYTNTTIMFV